MRFSFAPILAGLPLPEGMRRPRRAVTDTTIHEGTPMFRVVLHGPSDDPTCFGLGLTPEAAFRASMLGLFHHVSKCAGLDTTAAREYVARLTLN